MNIPSNIKTLAIFGLAKNTGKTTTLNALIQSLSTRTIALTSIGLDGEDFDQINHLPKPKIKAQKGTIIATAKETLPSNQTTYQVLKETTIQTALGKITIIKLLKDTTLLIAGPTLNSDLKNLIQTLTPLCDTILIDGALNRKTFTQLNTIDALILATGAAVSQTFEDTIRITKNTIKLFSLPQKDIAVSPNTSVAVFYNDHEIPYPNKHPNTLKTILQTMKPNTTLYIHGAITDTTIDAIIKHTKVPFKLIAEDPGKYLFAPQKLKHLNSLNIHLYVKHAVKLIAITINPWHPQSKHYDPVHFKTTLQKHTTLPVINVLEEGEHL